MEDTFQTRHSVASLDRYPALHGIRIESSNTIIMHKRFQIDRGVQ
jgi:hypothetical protein